jgi:hypothetical protein
MNRFFTIPLFLCALNVFAGAPYFVSDSCRTTKTVYSQKIQFSFDTVPAIADTVKDSTFSCNAGNCVWTYTIKAINTRVEQSFGFNYTILDSCDYIDTMTFSFFDAENDSCKFVVARFDTGRKRIFADSTWGDIASRPGVGKKIIFFHKSPFFSVTPGIIKVSNPTDTVWDSLFNIPVSIRNEISDSAFFEKLQGAWRTCFILTNAYGIVGYNGAGRFFGSSTDPFSGYFFDNKQVIACENGKAIKTTTIDKGYGYSRDGWEIQKPYHSDCQDPVYRLYFNEQFLFITSFNAPGTHGCDGTSKVCIRDTAIKSISPVLDNLHPAQADIFEFKIKPAPPKSSIAVSFTLRKVSPVHIALFDVSGRQIVSRPAQLMQPGHHELRIDCANLRNSMYLCRLKIADKVQTKPIIPFK